MTIIMLMRYYINKIIYNLESLYLFQTIKIDGTVTSISGVERGGVKGVTSLKGRGLTRNEWRLPANYNIFSPPPANILYTPLLAVLLQVVSRVRL